MVKTETSVEIAMDIISHVAKGTFFLLKSSQMVLNMGEQRLHFCGPKSSV